MSNVTASNVASSTTDHITAAEYHYTQHVLTTAGSVLTQLINHNVGY